MTSGASAAKSAASLRVSSALQQLGWTVGRNIQIDYRWSGGRQNVCFWHKADIRVPLFDHLVGEQLHRNRHLQSKRLGGLKIDY